MTVRERLAALLEETGISQSELGRRLAAPHQYVNNRIHGRATIAADELPALAAALRVPIASFFEDAQPGPSYADVFARAMAATWQRSMTAADQELIETIAAAMATYRQRLLTQETHGAHETPQEERGERTSSEAGA